MGCPKNRQESCKTYKVAASDVENFTFSLRLWRRAIECQNRLARHVPRRQHAVRDCFATFPESVFLKFFIATSVVHDPIPTWLNLIVHRHLWSLTLSHSHLLIHHLLKQLENHKRDRKERDRRPEWLNVFIHQTAALFEPLAGVARVGFQCELTTEGWEARLYLGSTEIVGGRDDGRSRLISFEFDFSRLAENFTRLDEFRWNVCTASDGTAGSFVTLRGQVDEHVVRLKIYSRPPQDIGPAFRLLPDGTLEDAVAI